MSGAVDLLLMISSKNGDSRVDFEVRKCRDFEPFTFAGEVHWGNGLFWMSARESKRKRKRYSRSQDFVIGILTTNGPMAVKDIMACADVCKPEAARSAVYQLANSGLIYRLNPDEMGQGVSAIYALKRVEDD